MTTSTLVFTSKPNGRLGSRKSKTGCITCKARKVKCDQAKPFCNRCRNADRICQGYEDVFVSTQTLTTKFGGSRSRSEEAPARIIIRSPSHDPCLGPNEARSLAFYVEKVGTYLGGAADIQFWGKSLPRLGQSEPAIKLCVVTVSNLFETQAKTDLPDSWEAQEAELHQAELYNKALSTTAERLKKDEGDVVALATCALLLAYYVMQGDEEQAVRLYHSGAPVIKKLLVRACSNQYPAAHEIAGIFLQFFERIAFAVKRFNMNVDFMNSEEVVAYTLKVNGSSDFRDCYDARQRLYRTMDIGYQLVEDTRDYRSGLQDLLDDDPMLEAWRARRAETIAIYSQWMDLFNRYCSRSKSDPEEAWLLSNCRMTFLTSHTYVVACLERNETNWLGQIEHFRTVVEEAEKMISYRSMRNTHFTFEAVFMVPLFLTAIKCRDLGIRYRALAAMRHSAYKEGLFKREEMIAMATRVVHLETLSDQTITGGFTFPPNGLVFDARKMSTETGVTRVAFRAKLGDAPDMWAAWEEDLVLSEHRFSTTELVERRLKPASIA